MPDEEQSRHVVITLHGIRTYGRWQERLQRILAGDKRWKHEQEKKEVLIYRYGVFTLFSFIIPFLRNLAVKQFRDCLESIFEQRNPDRVDIVAHSFGTYLAIEALANPKLAGSVKIHTAILCGSVLPPNRNVSHLLGPERPIGRIINECGIRDGVLLLTLPVYGVGMAGRLGLQGFEGRTLRSRYHRVGHSGYFERIGGRPYDGFMRRWWLPLLLGEEPTRERDRRPALPPFSDRLWRLLGENAGAFCVSLYVTILGSLIGTFIYLWSDADAARRIAEAQRKIAIANESRALTALSRAAFEDGRPNKAAQLALAAWPRDERDARPRLEATMQSLSRAVSAGRVYAHQWQHGGPVDGALLTNDERRILSWSHDKTLCLWDAASGQQIGPTMKHDGSVWGALLTKDERRILSWSLDNTLRLWDAATGQQIGPTMKHDGWVSGAMLTRDERRILSWSFDGTLRLWDAGWPKGNLLELVCTLLDDHDANNASKVYGVTIRDPICTPETATLVPDWSLIERASADGR